MDRQDFLSDENNLPGGYTRYLSGRQASVPDPEQPIKYKLSKLYKVDDFNRLASSVSNAPKSEAFERFLALRENPDFLARSAMKMPNTPFGPLSGYAPEGPLGQTRSYS